jgi:hypothetical protein
LGGDRKAWHADCFASTWFSSIGILSGRSSGPEIVAAAS